jgi:alanine racemase
MQRSLLYSTWVEVDLGAIENNVQYIRTHTATEVMAIVKANAYGHGAVPVALAALRGGATWLGVARDVEALELRRAGLECPILLLGFTPAGRFDEMIANRVSLTIWNEAHVGIAAASAQRVGEPARLHMKVDTGMSRLGIQPEDALTLVRQLINTEGVLFEGLLTHFAKADEVDPEPSNIQERHLNEVLEALSTAGLRPPLVHAANSAASLTRPSVVHNLVRLGCHVNISSEWPLPVRLSLKTAQLIKIIPARRAGHECITKAGSASAHRSVMPMACRAQSCPGCGTKCACCRVWADQVMPRWMPCRCSGG